jgi:hypothetical protein
MIDELWSYVENIERNYSTRNPHIQSQIQNYQTSMIVTFIVLSIINPIVVQNARR